jgi:hypothetical protein
MKKLARTLRRVAGVLPNQVPLLNKAEFEQTPTMVVGLAQAETIGELFDDALPLNTATTPTAAMETMVYEHYDRQGALVKKYLELVASRSAAGRFFLRATGICY